MHVVLVNPQIPQNTGSIARTCAATKTPLFIVGQPAFEISDRTVKRAGLDYWPYVQLEKFPDFQSYFEKHQPNTVWLLSKFATSPYYQAPFKSNDCLVFGSETKGLGQEFMSQFPPEQLIKIPMLEPGVRSLNLSNSVSIVLYEALKQVGTL